MCLCISQDFDGCMALRIEQWAYCWRVLQRAAQAEVVYSNSCVISQFSRKLMKATEDELSQEVEMTKQILFAPGAKL